MSDMDAIVRIAKQFKERDNVESFNISTVELINKTPVTFKVSDRIFISKEYENMVVSGTVAEYVSLETSPTGESYIAIPTPDGNTWFVLDKAVM